MYRLPGRPKLKVYIEEIEYLRGLRFTWTKTAKILRISRSTLYRRLEGVDLTCTYSGISRISPPHLGSLVYRLPLFP